MSRNIPCLTSLQHWSVSRHKEQRNEKKTKCSNSRSKFCSRHLQSIIVLLNHGSLLCIVELVTQYLWCRYLSHYTNSSQKGSDFQLYISLEVPMSETCYGHHKRFMIKFFFISFLKAWIRKYRQSKLNSERKKLYLRISRKESSSVYGKGNLNQ